jgi:hypothetical protein
LKGLFSRCNDFTDFPLRIVVTGDGAVMISAFICCDPET